MKERLLPPSYKTRNSNNSYKRSYSSFIGHSHVMDASSSYGCGFLSHN